MHVLGEIDLQLYLTRSSQITISIAKSKLTNMVSTLGKKTILRFFSLSRPSDLMKQGGDGVGLTFRLKILLPLERWHWKYINNENVKIKIHLTHLKVMRWNLLTRAQGDELGGGKFWLHGDMWHFFLGGSSEVPKTAKPPKLWLKTMNRQYFFAETANRQPPKFSKPKTIVKMEVKPKTAPFFRLKPRTAKTNRPPLTFVVYMHFNSLL